MCLFDLIVFSPVRCSALALGSHSGGFAPVFSPTRLPIVLNISSTDLSSHSDAANAGDEYDRSTSPRHVVTPDTVAEFIGI